MVLLAVHCVCGTRSFRWYLAPFSRYLLQLRGAHEYDLLYGCTLHVAVTGYDRGILLVRQRYWLWSATSLSGRSPESTPIGPDSLHLKVVGLDSIKVVT